MKILSIDSATECASIAVIDENKLLGEISLNHKKQHSVILMPMVDSLLKSLELTIKDMDGFVVSKGPGSFTGLRIGMSMIKGLSQGTNKPFISVSSLDALAYNMAYTGGIICPMLDALRDNVYTALYSFKNDKLIKLTDYMVLHIDELIEMLKQYDCSVTFLGDASLKFKSKLLKSFDKNHFAPNHLNLVKASSLGELGLNLLSSGIRDELFSTAPIYIRKPQAVREYEKRTGLEING
ncbi:tRNA (adenosine(37)-N6)-threonylcarbamoyltransferase complex dimerization subunit type 1 TsaB [Candidatus Clostridium radicumherbarum]|uniref:tRNA (Adenosine(37)-N6)-threonylcarbamoyltransferase complex dimerization subunit type 1 TsaB n=1 Tax=Candidatus Clostridium radicumherbarum TaxID=3381662 RepID=A0ABW8TP34_9CLOT